MRGEDPRLRIISDELWERVKLRQSAQASRSTGFKASTAGDLRRRSFPGCLFVSNAAHASSPGISVVISAHPGSTVGSSACSNQIVVQEKKPRRRSSTISLWIVIARSDRDRKREYQAAVLEEAKRKHQDTTELDALRAEEVLLRKMLRARTLSPDVAQAALDAVAIKRRKAASTVTTRPPVSSSLLL